MVEASRKWVCVRLASYENASEAKILESIFVGRSGQLENTVFAMLAPDGKTFLAPPGRSPKKSFRNAEYLAEAMDHYVEPYLKGSWSSRSLAKVENYRLALNVAACDGLPVVAVGSQKWEDWLAGLAWEKSMLGQAVFVRDSSVSGAVVVIPDQFGLTGRRVKELSQDMTASTVAEILRSYRAEPKDAQAHIRQGRRKGIHWTTKVPVTDPEGRY